MSGHDVGEKPNHQRERFGKHSEHLYRNQYRFYPHRRFRPEYLPPVVSVCRQVDGKEGAEGEHESHGNVSGEIGPSRENRYDSQQVVYEDEEKCRKCGLCAKQCPVGAIHGELGKVPYVIDQEKCIKCGQCINACHFNVIERK